MVGRNVGLERRAWTLSQAVSGSSSKAELIINLKTAKALGISFPLSLLVLADEVIE